MQLYMNVVFVNNLQTECENCSPNEAMTYRWELESADPMNTLHRLNVIDIRLNAADSSELLLDTTDFNVDTQEEYALVVNGTMHAECIKSKVHVADSATILI